LLAKDGIALGLTNKYGKAFVQIQRANFAPRFGFAYHVTPKLVARGGIGLFSIPLKTRDTVLTSARITSSCTTSTSRAQRIRRPAAQVRTPMVAAEAQALAEGQP